MIHQPFSGLFRIPFVRSCRLERREGPLEAEICNLSVEGVYVSSDPMPRIGEKLSVTFPLPGSEAPVTVEAEVCWRNPAQHHKVGGLPPGCGLHFLTLSAPDWSRIEAFVRTYREPGPHRPEWI